METYKLYQHNEIFPLTIQDSSKKYIYLKIPQVLRFSECS